jgi:hypothetical protein
MTSRPDPWRWLPSSEWAKFDEPERNWFRDKSGTIWLDCPYSEAKRIPPEKQNAARAHP